MEEKAIVGNTPRDEHMQSAWGTKQPNDARWESPCHSRRRPPVDPAPSGKNFQGRYNGSQEVAISTILDWCKLNIFFTFMNDFNLASFRG